MRKICSYPGCNTPVEVDDFDRSSPRCFAHPATHTPKKIYAHHYHDGKNIYHTYRWRKLRQAYAEKNPLCEHCLRYDILTPVDVVDHVREVKDGGEPFDYNNLMSMCRSCHSAKTIKERRKRNKKGSMLSDF
jgi:5-methylcytosine-specific restriction protein A